MKTINKYRRVYEVIAEYTGYTKEEISAAKIHHDRKYREAHPRGKFDDQGRFYPSEVSRYLENIVPPTPRFPYSLNKAARSADHVAEAFGARNSLNVKRLCRFIEFANSFDEWHSSKNFDKRGKHNKWKDLVDRIEATINQNRRADRKIDLSRTPKHKIVEIFCIKFMRETRSILKAPSQEIFFMNERLRRQITMKAKRLKTAPVTKPVPRVPFINKNKPVRIVAVAVKLGFRPRQINSELIYSHEVSKGHIVLKATKGAKITVTPSADIFFARNISDPHETLSNGENINIATMSEQEITLKLQKAILSHSIR